MAKIHEDTFVFSRVPKEARVSFLTVTLVNMGVSTSLSQFMLGATLGHGMTFWQAMFATCLGSLALEFVSLGLGFMGMKEGLSTSLLARWCGFGRIGSALIGIIIVISCLGWFGVQNSILAEGISYALNGQINFGWAAAFSGIALTFLVASGFRGLALTAKIAVPLFFAVILYIFLDLIFKDHIVINEAKNTASLSLSQAATMVAGGFMAGALTMPDISRYCKSNHHVFWMITLCIIVSEFLINAVSILIAQAFNSADIVGMMTINAGFIGLASVILSAVKVNDSNLYSSSLGLANSLQGLTGKKFSYFKLTVCLGIVGTILSVLGILDHFVDFLSVLGIIFPPIAGVMMVDYYILRTNRKLLDKIKMQEPLPDASTSLIGWAAIVACIAGTTVGAVFEYGIPSLDSVIAAGIVYWLLMKIKEKLS